MIALTLIIVTVGVLAFFEICVKHTYVRFALVVAVVFLTAVLSVNIGFGVGRSNEVNRLERLVSRLDSALERLFIEFDAPRNALNKSEGVSSRLEAFDRLELIIDDLEQRE